MQWRGYSEYITDNTFDFGYARNSLDHSYDPVRVICNMVKAIKPGGSRELAAARGRAFDVLKRDGSAEERVPAADVLKWASQS